MGRTIKAGKNWFRNDIRWQVEGQTTDMFPETGQSLGPYKILDELGGGGMARVFRAWDGRLHREVAIKVIDDRYSMPGIAERFLLEARAASGLNHPNICTIFDIGEQDGAPYLVMELLEGETLKSRIAESAMSVEEILRLGAEISDAHAAAHSRGIVHRDIKPANIFLVKKPNGSVQSKMLDFGLAKMDRQTVSQKEADRHLTSMGATVGTVSYMSPEQARGEQLDARSDLFSLGIVLYEMATGELPFKGTTSALVFVQLLGDAPPDPVRQFNGEIPADLEQVILKLLDKNPEARFQSAAELCDVLQDLAEKRSGWLTRLKNPPPVVTMPVPEPEPREPRSRPHDPPRVPQAVQVRMVWDEDSVEPKQPPRKPEKQLPEQRPEKRPDELLDQRMAAFRRAAPEEYPTEAPKKPQRHSLGAGGQIPVASDPLAARPSGVKPVRSSIASNPRMSFPTTAPYSGQTSAQRAATDKAAARPKDAAAQMPANRPAPVSHETAAKTGRPANERPGLVEPKPKLAPRSASDAPFDVSLLYTDVTAQDAPFKPKSTGIPNGHWKWAVPALGLIALAGGLLARHLHWL